MKSLFVLLSFLIFVNWNNQQPEYKLSTFKTIPNDMDGCGNNLYLSEKDKKADISIYRDNDVEAILLVNGKFMRFKPVHSKSKFLRIGKSGQFTLKVSMSSVKTKDSEYYTFKAFLTVLKGRQIIYNKRVIGDGGC